MGTLVADFNSLDIHETLKSYDKLLFSKQDESLFWASLYVMEI